MISRNTFLIVALHLFCVLFFYLRSGPFAELNRNLISGMKARGEARAEALEPGPLEIRNLALKHSQTAVFFSPNVEKDVYLVQRSVYALWPVKWEANARYGFALKDEALPVNYQMIERGSEVNFVERLPH